MINKQKNYNANYEAPTLEIIEVKIEQGFAGSNGNESIGDRFGDQPW